jgi:hypothetical protein
MSNLRIGVDFGGVCSINSEKYENESRVGVHETINVPGCVEALRQLRQLGHSLFLVSFCGAKRAETTAKFLITKHPELFERAFFVKKRSYKDNVCLALGLDVMIDDRVDILQTITKSQTIWFSNEEKTQGYDPTNQCISWAEVLEVVPTLQNLSLDKRVDIALDKYIYDTTKIHP